MSDRYLPVARTLISCDSGENTRSVPAPLPELRLAIRRSPAFSGVSEVPSLNCSSIEGQAGTACSTCVAGAGTWNADFRSSAVASPRRRFDSSILPSMAGTRALRRKAIARSERRWVSSGSRVTICRARPAALAEVGGGAPARGLKFGQPEGEVRVDGRAPQADVPGVVRQPAIQRSNCLRVRGRLDFRRLHACAQKERKRVIQRLLQVHRKSTRLNSSHLGISYAVFCLKNKHTC